VNADFFLNADLDGHAFTTRATDLSVCGLGLLMPRARRGVPPDTAVGLQFTLPWSHEVGWAVGRVTRLRGDRAGTGGTALRFTYLTPCTRRLLERYVFGQRQVDGGRDARCRTAHRVRYPELLTLIRGCTGLLFKGVNLSADGLSCYRLIDPDVTPIGAGEDVIARLRLGGDLRFADLPARVMRHQHAGAHEVVGLRFTDPTRLVHRLLEGYVARRVVGQT
jgi:hypothetical protein